MAKHKETIRQTSESNSFNEYYKGGLWRCPLSPTGAHHWLIDSSRCGECKYCGERRQFHVSAVSSYGDAGYIDWGQANSLEEYLRELLPIA